MGRIEVAPPEVRELGGRVRAFGPSIQGIAADASGLTGLVSEPSKTGAALDDFAVNWFQGLSRLADDVQVLGILAQLAASGYEVTDNTAMPNAGGQGPP